MAPDRAGHVEAALGGFEPAMREVLVPVLFYKAHFLGEWFQALAQAEPDPDARRALTTIGLDTLREALETIATAQEWERLHVNPGRLDALAKALQRRALTDMLTIKDGNAEAMLLLAMQAPTPELRNRITRLADADRAHADHLRAVQGERTIDEKLQMERMRARGEPLGAHEGRSAGRSLGATIRDVLARFPRDEAEPRRLVVSATALRHLRDEGMVDASGLVFGLPVDIDFGWEGESFAVSTSERVSLAEIMTRGAGPRTP